MLYNTGLIITYNFYDPILRKQCTDKFDLEDVEEFEDLSELIYQSELLKAFNLTDITQLTNKMISDLYDNLKTSDIFLKYLEDMKSNFIYDDLETVFTLLFSYDYFFITHKHIQPLGIQPLKKVVPKT
jgi:hypothetical protein